MNPRVEGIESRCLPSGLGHAHARAAAIAPGPGSAYSLVFEGTLPVGHGKSTAIDGPISLDATNDFGKVVGSIDLGGGAKASVVGLNLLGGVSLKITLPDGYAVHAAGAGVLRRVPGAGPGAAYTLLGRGELTAFRGPSAVGGWVAIRA